MKKRNSPHAGYYKVAGGAVEQPDITRPAKQALAREQARLKKQAGGKTWLNTPPAPPQIDPGAHVEEAVREARAEREVRSASVRAVRTRSIGLLRRMYGLAERLATLPRVIAEHFRGDDQQASVL